MASLREQLLGAWELASFEFLATNGTDRLHPMGQEPHGAILYSACGFMAVQMVRPGRPRFASGEWLSGTPAEYKEASTGHLAYSGRFETDEGKKLVKHHMAVAMFPNWEGQTQVRTARIEGDMLFLGTESPITFGNATYMAEIVWRRSRPTS